MRFFELIAAGPNAHFIVLREPNSGAAVAFTPYFVIGDHFINKFIGLDYRQPRERLLYFRLWNAAVDRAIELGATVLQNGQTGYGPKIDLGHRIVPLTTYVAHRNPLIHRLYATVARRIDWETLDLALAAALVAHPELRSAP